MELSIKHDIHVSRWKIHYRPPILLGNNVPDFHGSKINLLQNHYSGYEYKWFVLLSIEI